MDPRGGGMPYGDDDANANTPPKYRHMFGSVPPVKPDHLPFAVSDPEGGRLSTCFETALAAFVASSPPGTPLSPDLLALSEEEVVGGLNARRAAEVQGVCLAARAHPRRGVAGVFRRLLD